jgi:[acyl-carrier-protein] S-malonyltransferase
VLCNTFKKSSRSLQIFGRSSLGEFSALVASGVLSLNDAMHIVHKRGEFMIRANDGTPFAMAAIIGLDAEKVVEICAEASEAGLVQAVNFNTPIQTVISGTESGVAQASDLAKTAGAIRELPSVVWWSFSLFDFKASSC